ncbi:hypothetical protein HJC23_002854 [Cyclotella cryptica]|uniref:DNA replication regulator Sld3 C-terminal domain-containing protein n=1 Tax=Cyclotella cryptica TaxID=29204 RepID=A0ABD3P6P4_9STRA|eukprot:CCRYP_017237-RA/>CCRYP_017237-RA protein AED:0.00 eAED:0.00 QI:294/1/1/1/1/1/2/217/811
MSNMNSVRDGTASALDVSSNLSASCNKSQQPSSKQPARSQRTSAIALNRNPSLNSTASSTTHGTNATRRSKESTSSTSRGTSHASKLSVDEILSSTKYSLDGRKRKTWTREEMVHATNVRMLNSLRKAESVDQHATLVNQHSPKMYNFPSRNECLRRLGSPVKESKGKGDLGDKNTSQHEAEHINEATQGSTNTEIRSTEFQEGDTPKRSSSRLDTNTSMSSVPEKVTPDDLPFDTESSTQKNILITAPSSPPTKPHRTTTQTAAEAVSQLIEKYTSCLRQKEPSPIDVVQLFCPLLDYLDFSSYEDKTVQSQDGNVVMEGLGQIIKSAENVKLDVMNRGINGSEGDANGSREDDLSVEEKLIRMLQIQIWIRVMVWNFCREEGWDVIRRVLELDGRDDGRDEKRLNSKRKRKQVKRESKSNSALQSSQCFVKEIISLCELAPYVLPPSLEFSQWLKNTLTFNFQQSIPEFGSEILDHFEVEFVDNSAESKADITMDSSKLRKSEVTPHSDAQFSARGTSLSKKAVAKGSARQQAFFSSLARKPLSFNADGESATIGSDVSIARSHSTTAGSSKTTVQSDKEADAALFKTSISLTAAVPERKENPFLKNSARGVYVGSHLSSKLSNIATLFREVKAPPKPKPGVVTAKKKNPLIDDDNVALGNSVRRPSTQPQSTLASLTSKPGVARLSLDHPTETPRKKLKPTPDSRWSDINLPSVNNYVASTPLKIIGETPAKKPRHAARRFNSALDGIFVRQSVEMTPQRSGVNSRYERMRSDSNAAVGGNLCFGLSPMPQHRQGSKLGSKGGRKKWN